MRYPWHKRAEVLAFVDRFHGPSESAILVASKKFGISARSIRGFIANGVQVPTE